MRYEHKTESTCAQMISVDIDGDVIRNIEFYGGCKLFWTTIQQPRSIC